MPRLGAPSVFQRAAAVLIGMLVLAAGIIFSAAILVIVLAVGVVVFGYFWWKTRALRAAMKEAIKAQQAYRDGHGESGISGQSGAPQHGGQVIEGEAVVVEGYDTAMNAAPAIDVARCPDHASRPPSNGGTG